MSTLHYHTPALKLTACRQEPGGLATISERENVTCRRCQKVLAWCPTDEAVRLHHEGVSPSLKDALLVIAAASRSGDGIYPALFAGRMWPDSEAHRISYKCGPYGSARGIALNRSAGAYLGKLARQGWIYNSPDRNHRSHYFLTRKGREVVRAWRGEDQ